MSAPGGPPVTVVVVLYGTSPGTSTALTSLAAALGSHADRFAVEVHDNSPHPGEDRTVPGLDLAADVRHADNPGLAVPYNEALASATQRGSTWLVLLDQDTTVTAEYVAELVALADPSAPTGPAGPPGSRVAVASPLLVQRSLVLSPHGPMWLRPRAIGAPGEYGPDRRWTFLNSGTAIRVEAASAVGGFPTDYPLDFLDHAMAWRLRQGGYSLLLLRSTLVHDLAVMEMASVPAGRISSIYAAENRYFATSTDVVERAWLLVRRSLRAALLLTGIRRSPNRDIEIRAAVDAGRMVVAPGAYATGPVEHRAGGSGR